LGGLLYLASDTNSHSLTITDSTITNTSAYANGGVIYTLNTPTIAVTSTAFDNTDCTEEISPLFYVTGENVGTYSSITLNADVSFANFKGGNTKNGIIFYLRSAQLYDQQGSTYSGLTCANGCVLYSMGDVEAYFTSSEFDTISGVSGVVTYFASTTTL